MPATADSHIFCRRIATPEGTFVAGYSTLGLRELHFPSGATVAPLDANSAVPPQIHRWHRLTTVAVKKILVGRPPVEFPPLDLTQGTEFQQQVWRALLQIKRGQTRSYGELARTIGKASAGRAVGGACGANPVPLLVPCHRVLAANQKLGGFSGGVEWKKKLLLREGVYGVR